MAITQASTTYFAYKKETTPNVEESGAGGTKLRRVTGTLDLDKVEVRSAEKRTDFQDVNVNHGTRSANFELVTEYFAGDYKEFLAAVLRQDFNTVTAVAASGGDGFSIASGVVARAGGGSFVDDDLRLGQVFRFSNMTETGINNRNIRITSDVAPGSFSAVVVDGGAPLADSAASETATITVPGQSSFIPLTGHTKDTFTIERHDSANTISDVAYGCKIGSLTLDFQPDQPVGVTFSGIGIDRSEYESVSLTSPTEAGTGAALSSTIGAIRINGQAVAVCTGASVTINTGIQNQALAFANVSPDVFYGRVADVTGTITLLRDTIATQRLFDDETEASIELFCEAPGANPKTFTSVFLPRVKFNSAGLDDPDGPAVLTMGFTAYRLADGAAGSDQTTILIQDSSIV
ncbi:MAG: phage tail tube protein [Pseudomonadota bacterium]